MAATTANDAMDLLIIGGGPAGGTAADRALDLGARVSLIEPDHIGGT